MYCCAAAHRLTENKLVNIPIYYIIHNLIVSEFLIILKEKIFISKNYFKEIHVEKSQQSRPTDLKNDYLRTKKS